MDAWIDVRRKARACYQAAVAKSGGDRRAKAIIKAALEQDDLEVRTYQPGTQFGLDVLGSFDRSSKLVNVAKQADHRDELVVIAHEIGHFKMHRDPVNEVTILPVGLGGDPVDSGVRRVEGYSPRERKEVQADIFAAELLCPADWLRHEIVVNGHRPSDIAAELGLPDRLVIAQAGRALLLPALREAPPASSAGDTDLDESQKAAATWNAGPLLVNAGPGTGKTRTLVRRIKHLLDNGSTSGTILALTFSNKAAEEMRERLSALSADDAIEMWVGTFHAFGLELVSKWPLAVGRTADVTVLDEAGALALLESNLAKLPLRYYQNLYEPAYELVHVLRAISRCKDELISHEQYRTAAEEALRAAKANNDADAEEAAEKALEVAEIYRIYEEALKKADAVDFGDLVLCATRLVEHNPQVQNAVAKYKHVLVDEYQDVNLASSRLLRAICQLGVEAWVVADQRQSIYRFRGAEPSNVSRFPDEFSGTTHSLSHNYRSFAPVVRTFERFSASMGDNGAMAGTWTADRAEGGRVTLTVSPHLTAEAEAIRDKIEEFRSNNVAYGDQAILARTHLTLARVTGILEQLGVPLLYLGDLFERTEIRDLLSLIALDAERGGFGLVRLATLSEYGATRDDALTALRWAEANEMVPSEALARLPEIDGLSEVGRAGLARLGTQLQGLGNASPWTLLTNWLFERSDYLRPLLLADDAKAQQKLVAIYHLLKVCGEHDGSRKALLSYIRRIEALNQESSYRMVASEASDMDAVRVLTIHGSKGLEFGAVHFPALATRYMPTNRQGVRCPPPPSLPQLAMQPGDHDAEEECLFFVGLSRARDFLSLSRAERYTTQGASVSKFLSILSGTVPSQRHEGSGASYAHPIQLSPPSPQPIYRERDLDLYRKCPARYRYEVIEGLRDGHTESAYVQFHRCVDATVAWLEEQRASGKPANFSAGLGHLASEWSQRGPIGHAFEQYYRSTAEDMVTTMANSIAAEAGKYDRDEWIVPVGSHQVAVAPDRVHITPDGVIHVQRIRTGRQTKSEPDNAIYALLRLGAAAKYPGKMVSIETFYLARSEAVSVLAKSDEKRLKDYSGAIAGIESGDFHCQFASNRDPLFASNRDPSGTTGMGLSP